ncbi:ABC transporter substrate-binding protein [Cohnella cholangitidis]|uniref:Carbohydrate ABC transporter substrate-binding protein n=1 Tax=Cohnella cholangitidis TaxID=2598458 RepID=A0A7G5C4S7_9BACL|nr:ABC transporter substrate-binding protein [Cohnella cholangitidis]QMV44211.1 carbohydrate ABC transporter substrate-binding protein [Cohnella cholangitidis]
MKRKSKVTLLLTAMLASFTVITACGGSNEQGASSSSSPSPAASQSASSSANKEKVTLKMAIWDVNNDFLTYLDEKVKEYTAVASNVKVELETFKSDGDYLQAMKVRATGNELPDIMGLKPNWLHDFQEQLLPLDGEAYLAKNKYADKFAIDGKVYAVPMMAFPELVYYHPSIFQELNLQVPTTWPQFVDVLTKIKDNSKYIPYAMGGKDAWPDYPFNEFLPQIVSGSESYLSDMAKDDQPFSEGKPFHKAYKQIEQLYSSNVMGPDPLGISWDQATDLFSSKQAAVVAAGSWFAPTYESKVGNIDDLAAFPMPYRESENEPLKLMMFTDHFYGITNGSDHQDEAKAFLTWFFSPDVYQTYIDAQKLVSTFEGVESNVPFLNAFFASNKNESFSYIPGDAEYTRITNAIQLDVKAIGQDMMAGKKVDDILPDLNDKWAKAKASK